MSALTAIEWAQEFRRRWPAAVGVMRGKTVIYQATLGPPQKVMVVLNNPNGAVVMDTIIICPDPPATASATAAPSPAPDAAEHGTGVDGGTGVAGKSALLSPPEERAQHAPPAGGPHLNPQ